LKVISDSPFEIRGELGHPSRPQISGELKIGECELKSRGILIAAEEKPQQEVLLMNVPVAETAECPSIRASKIQAVFIGWD
jgi:hypothetical protein